MVAAGGWSFASNSTKPDRAQDVEAAQTGSSGILDGMTFSGQVTVKGEPLDVVERWVFAHGAFESSECSLRCNYPRAPYFVRQLGEAIEFISESRCIDKDAKIVWHGTIEDGTAKGTMTWTISRWYWTIEKKFRFEGTLTERAASAAGT